MLEREGTGQKGKRRDGGRRSGRYERRLRRGMHCGAKVSKDEEKDMWGGDVPRFEVPNGDDRIMRAEAEDSLHLIDGDALDRLHMPRKDMQAFSIQHIPDLPFIISQDSHITSKNRTYPRSMIIAPTDDSEHTSPIPILDLLVDRHKTLYVIAMTVHLPCVLPIGEVPHPDCPISRGGDDELRRVWCAGPTWDDDERADGVRVSVYRI